MFEILLEIIEALVKIIIGLIVGAIILFFVAVIVAFFYDAYLSMRYGVGVVSQDGNSSFVKEFKNEEGGCIYYIDELGSDSKACGAYKVKRFK